MKVSRAQAAENRERILEVATRLFRERGIDGIGVADLMKAAGLTHGGFYGHFKSKEDLVAQACARAVIGMKQNWTNVIKEAAGDPLAALANQYLSPTHRDHAGSGCPIAALGSEVARQAPVVRQSVTEELRPFLEYLSSIVPGDTKTSRRKRALSTFSSLVGALILSRAVDDPALSNEILRSVATSVRTKTQSAATPPPRSRTRSR
jgi:TetR/AcrR family transcriptional repressor of nem operon